jgi:hypothetical protein
MFLLPFKCGALDVSGRNLKIPTGRLRAMLVPGSWAQHTGKTGAKGKEEEKDWK